MQQASTSGSDAIQQAYTTLVQRWPARQQQINELFRCFITRASGCTVLVSGLPGTGKTSIVRDVLEQLSWTGAYVLCSDSSKPRQIYSSILSQISGAKRKRSNGFLPEHTCDNANDFLLKLPSLAPANSPAKFVILDHAHRLSKTAILGTILRSRKLTSANISVVLVSTFGWGSGAFHSEGRPDVCVAFPSYDQAQLADILVKDIPALEPDADLYRTFLTTVVIQHFWQLTKRLSDLQALAKALYPSYAKPLTTGMVDRPVNAAGYAVLHSRVQPHVRELLGRFELGAATLAKPAKPAGQAAGAACDVDLPLLAKLLLVAAYVASRNKATTDKVVFEGGRSGKGRRSATAQDRQAEAAKEAQLKGPHNFPLQRLLLIARVLARNEGEEAAAGGVPRPGLLAAAGGGEPGQGLRLDSVDVLQQVSSLVGMKLLQQVGDDPLEAPRYACNAPDELVTQLCHELRIKLTNYLRLA